MKIEEIYKSKLIELLSEQDYEVRESESGYVAVKNYLLGERLIFFEVSKKTKSEFRVRISLSITNLPVRRIHCLVNERIANSPIITYPMSFLSKKLNKVNENFEMQKYNGILGSVVSEEALPQYILNLRSCLRELILPFFEKFEDQAAFYNWLVKPVLDGRYNFDSEPVWKDALSSLIIAKLVGSGRMEELYQKWLELELPKGPGFDTREELIKLKDILDEEVNG